MRASQPRPAAVVVSKLPYLTLLYLDVRVVIYCKHKKHNDHPNPFHYSFINTYNIMNRLQRVDRSSVTFNTDITSSSANDTCNSGVIHAIKIKDFDDGDGGLLQHEENAIAWVEDANHASVNALIDQLISLDFGEDRMRFIPYSSKAAWMQRYPRASELHCFHYSSRCNTYYSYHQLLTLTLLS